MINIVTETNRKLFRHALMEMHRQRKAVFIDRLGWRLNETVGLEIDAFDKEHAVYLVETKEDGEVVQSARLLPTTEPHLMSEAFPHLCSGECPRGLAIWEATRFCPAPHIQESAAQRQCLGRMIAAIMETAILFGVEQVTFVASAALAPLAREAGWDVRPLGATTRIGRERLIAMIADINTPGLQRVRARYNISGPLTRFADPALPRAA